MLGLKNLRCSQPLLWGWWAANEGDWTNLRPCPRGWCVSSTM